MVRPFLLYLRPFSTDGRLIIRNPQTSSLAYYLLFSYQMGVREDIDLEEYILRSTKRVMSFLAIGKEVGAYGGGRITRDDSSWQTAFKKLSKHAACIFSVPGLSKYTLWELEWLAQNSYFKKVCMIFSEEVLSMSYKSNEYAELLHKLSNFGWHIPPFEKRVNIVVFNENGAVAKNFSSRGFGESAFVEVARSMRKNYVTNEQG